MNEVASQLSVILANTYALYLKTQNYHWHVSGPHFYSLHGLFETQYLELANAVDGVAERLLKMGEKAPATFKDYLRLMTMAEGDSGAKTLDMVSDLANSHKVMLEDLQQVIELAQSTKDEGSVALLSERIAAHEKAHWMLSVSCEPACK